MVITTTFSITFTQEGITGSIEVKATLNPNNTVTLEFSQSGFIADFGNIFIDFNPTEIGNPVQDVPAGLVLISGTAGGLQPTPISTDPDLAVPPQTDFHVAEEAYSMPGAPGSFDIQIDIGDSGIGQGKGDVQTVTLTLSEGSPLSGQQFLDALLDAEYGFRLTSVGEVDGNGNPIGDRTASLKIVGGFEDSPSLKIVKDAPQIDGKDQLADHAGEVLKYNISVENTGNVDLTGIVVTDPNADPGSIQLVVDAASSDGVLDVGETWHYTAEHTVTQAELDSNGGGDGDIDNIAKVVSNETPEDTDDAAILIASLNIVKDAPQIDGKDQLADVAGEKLYYNI